MDLKHSIILAHDSFTQFGGAERVAKGLTELYSNSPMYTIATDQKIVAHFPNTKFYTSFVQIFYKWLPKLQFWFPLIPIALKFFKVEATQIVLSSSSAYMKGLKKPKGSIHINYCHTPTRFLWSDNIYAKGEVPKLLRSLMGLYFRWLRRWDLAAARNVDYFIANSKEVQKRIQKYYNKDSHLIYPFIDTEFWKPSIQKQNYFLIAGRLTPYKGYDTIVKIFKELKLPLHVVGSGRYETHLKQLAGNSELISFFGKVSDEELRDQYSGAVAFIYPQIEDFGLMPLEAASCGTPTIGLAEAGSLETILPGISGILLEQFTLNSLEAAISEITTHTTPQDKMIAHASKFSKEKFFQEISNFVRKVKDEHYS